MIGKDIRNIKTSWTSESNSQHSRTEMGLFFILDYGFCFFCLFAFFLNNVLFLSFLLSLHMHLWTCHTSLNFLQWLWSLTHSRGPNKKSYEKSWRQNRRQKIFSRGALRLCAGVDIENVIKPPLIYSVSDFNLGCGCFSGGVKSTKAPRGDETA